MSNIQAIPKDDAARLCSGQVITTLVDAVKELLDNSLDSGAESIEIRLQDSGLESIEVVDDGRGIPESDLEKVCEKYATSKISSFEDLNNVESFGFRGEALSSLASLSSGIKVHTKTEGLDIGFKIDYDREGKMVKKTRFPRTRGTSVKVVKLFSALPVREKYMKGKIKQQLAKLVSVIKGYSFANVHLKLTLLNQDSNGKKELLNVTPATGLEQRIHGIITHEPILSKIVKTRIFKEVAEEFGVEPNKENIKHEDSINLSGFISNPKHGKSNSDWQFVSINSRPVDYPKLCKIVNQVFRSFDPTGNGNQYPILIINFTIPSEYVDVNVTPDKRTVFVSNEKVLFAVVKSSILQMFNTATFSFEQAKYNQSSSQLTVISSDDQDDEDPHTRANVLEFTPQPANKISVSSSGSSRQITDFWEPTERPNRPLVMRQQVPASHPASVTEPSISNYVVTGPTDGFRPVSEMVSESGFELPMLGKPVVKPKGNPFLSSTQITDFESGPQRRRRSLTPDHDSSLDNWSRKRSKQFSSSPPARSNRSNDSFRFESGDLTSSVRPRMASSPLRMPPPKVPTITIGDDVSVKSVIDNEQGPIPGRRRVKCSFDFKEFLNSVPEGSPLAQPKFTPNLDLENEETAVIQMSKEMDKSQFKDMKVIGQFNKGFIITKLGSALFVIDQHASDERRNFDELLESKQLDPQALIKPIPLSLSAYEEYLIKENIGIFTKNGFRLSHDPNLGQGSRYSITGVPSSGDKMFGVDEIEEILEVIKDSKTAANSMRPKKVKDMLAMKACRKSIMIGDDLNRSQMTKLVHRMSETSNPWTCAHGRPTVRCLGSIRDFRKYF